MNTITRVVAEFALTFDQNVISPDARLFSTVHATKKLDEMPVFPKSLKVSGKLCDYCVWIMLQIRTSSYIIIIVNERIVSKEIPGIATQFKMVFVKLFQFPSQVLSGNLYSANSNAIQKMHTKLVEILPLTP